ncbi:MAG: hypothetical protein M2R45_05115 [Verrucomicrobia subdivision 3 bacterium]|nr:hypothetical protein [Limisphaerales bacterium]MCS1417177.1 hypothetical protein [Limisphaerales bacterium]
MPEGARVVGEELSLTVTKAPLGASESSRFTY